MERVERQQIDGTYKSLDNFPPLNLKWSHVGGSKLDLSPEFEKFCDLGFIVDPEALRELPLEFEIECRRQTELGGGTEMPVFTFDLEVKPNHGGHIVGKGTYRVHLAIGAANVSVTRACLEMYFPGKWLEPDVQMYSQGLRLRFSQ